MNDLHVAALQTPLYWENKTANLEMFTELLKPLANKTDLVVLPEMFTTGFSMAPEKFAESMEGPTVRWMQQQAQQLNAHITGSFICKENESYFNRLVWMQPDGHFRSYDKRHLFSMGNEHLHYTAGTEHLIVEINGWKICPLICYDLRFPVWSRNNNQTPFDVLLYVANWPEVRAFPWSSLLVARAIENQCYVIGVNRVGKDGNNIDHSGNSVVLGPRGNQLYGAQPKEATIIQASLNKQELVAFRDQFPVLNDADRFHLDH